MDDDARPRLLNFKSRQPGLLESLFPVALLIGALIGVVWIFGDDSTGGPSQVVLMLCGFAAALMAHSQGTSWRTLETAVLKSVGFVTQAILILLLVGALIGTWILGGIVPTLIVWGLELLSPSVFLAASSLICALVSLATGSSWSTAGTLGLALIGIGGTLGISPAMTAGAVISGAYFGDKMSPFSETTNLASSMVSVDLFVHIRHMLYTTGPGFAIAFLIFLGIGLTDSGEGFDPARIRMVTEAINARFDTGLYMLLPVLILFALVALRVPAIPALLTGSILGMVFAAIFQPGIVTGFAGESGLHYGVVALKASLQAAANGFESDTGVKAVDGLLSRGGMFGMLTTVWLILAAMFFSGVMEGSGMLQKIAAAILSLARGTGNLIAATIGTATFMNFTASEQYLSIVLTGRMYKDAYERQGLHPKNLSRALEDSGTLTSALVPWNTCGAFMASTLGVATFAYAPFAFLNYINPLISILYGYTGVTIEADEERAGE